MHRVAARAEGAEAFVVVSPGTSDERTVPITERLFVGRECLGVDEQHRLLVDDPTVSRQHFEIRLEPEHDRASLLDNSTNGTRLNGVRIGRGAPAPLRPGDRITVGETVIEFRSDRYHGKDLADDGRTIRRVTLSKLVMAVGDIAGYSTISQYTDSNTMLSALEVLYGGLRGILERYRGTLSDYAGDAMFVVWELDEMEDAPKLAVDFCLEAVDGVRQLAPMLPIREPDGSPIYMGWGLVTGEAAVSSMTGALLSVVGDATNLAFRLSGVAARNGRPSVIITEALQQMLPPGYALSPPDDVEVKGRTGTEKVYGVLGREPA